MILWYAGPDYENVSAEVAIVEVPYFMNRQSPCEVNANALNRSIGFDNPVREEDFEEEEPQEEEDMDIDDEEDENKPELTFPYKESDPLNPPLPASDSELSVEEGAAVMENLVRKLGNAKERAECKKLKKELEEARFINTLLSMQKERVERDLYWTRVQAYEFYQDMIRRGITFEERPNEAINVLVKDEESPSSEPRGSPRDS
ncbi:hypothetical protein Tco_1359244 [Tanacetum coccineum]